MWLYVVCPNYVSDVVVPIQMRMTGVNVMANNFARRNMWDSDYRQEQIFTRDFLAKLYPEWEIKQEYPVKNLTIDGKRARPCILDIAVPKEMIAIRLNGEYHFTSGRQQLKDEFQKEALQQAGWDVLDFDCFKMINLFKKNKKEETVKLAEGEILKQLGKHSNL